MPSYHVERSIVIDKPLLEVRDSLKNFKAWPRWSPWLVMEPDATLTYTQRQGQVGASYGWSGMLVGAGSMELLTVHDDLLEMEINFVKPFKSRADVAFKLQEVEAGTEVSWVMNSALPFFLFWMRSKMETFIGMDYERGLGMLKVYLETGSVPSYSIIEGVVMLPEQTYIGIPNQCTLNELGVVMKKDFETLYDFMKENDISMDGVPFCIYNRFDIFRKEAEYIACIPVKKELSLPQGWVKGKVLPQEALKTIHRGAYLYLGNAWMTAMNYARIKKMKTGKMPVGYEFYPNNPYDTAEEDLLTEIYLPLRP